MKTTSPKPNPPMVSPKEWETLQRTHPRLQNYARQIAMDRKRLTLRDTSNEETARLLDRIQQTSETMRSVAVRLGLIEGITEEGGEA